MVKWHKIAACCAVGTIILMNNTKVTRAAEVPIAGIDVLLSDFYNTNDDVDLLDILKNESANEFSNLSFANVDNYVNIRSEANEDSEILGKLYDNSAATILEKADGWYKVKSGSVTGYIKADYLITGEDAVELAKTSGTKIATVTTETLKVREKADLNSSVLTLIPIDDEYKVLKEGDNWIKIALDGDTSGYVSTDFVKVSTVFEEAVSIEEERERLEAEEAANEENNQAGRDTDSNSTYSSQSDSNSNDKSNNTVNESSDRNESTDSNSSVSGSSSYRNKIVQYALQFRGNPYVWGGTSLTNGADCSGFTQSVFRDNGIYIPRTSRTQATGGKRVSLDNVQPGDLIFYEKYGSINHVALYIGNGQVISASSPSTGIRITSYNYRQPVKAVSYIN